MPKHSFPAEHSDKSRLEYYAHLYNSIEINSSFYKKPMTATVNRWAQSVPDHFRFTFKLWREITHNKNHEYQAEQLESFLNVIIQTGEKLGCLLIQFPPKFKIVQFNVLRVLLGEVRMFTAPTMHVAVEFRDKSWYCEEVYQLLNDVNIAMVIHDRMLLHSPLQELDAPFVYLRFHGPGGDYRGSYTDDVLYEYAGYAAEWLASGKDVYTYFNNTMGAALQNLDTFNRYIKELC